MEHGEEGREKPIYISWNCLIFLCHNLGVTYDVKVIVGIWENLGSEN